MLITVKLWQKEFRVIDDLYSGIGNIRSVKQPNYSKTIQRLNIIPVKIPKEFFTNTEQSGKLMWSYNNLKLPTSLKQYKQKWRHHIPHLKRHRRPQCQLAQAQECSTTENPETSRDLWPVEFCKDPKYIEMERITSSLKQCGNLDSYAEE